MNIFYEMASRLGFYKDVKNCLLKGFTPCAVTGVSNIHKAQTAMALSRLSPCLVICDDEASAIRMTGDINEMAGEQLACVFPAKDLNFAYMDLLTSRNGLHGCFLSVSCKLIIVDC